MNISRIRRVIFFALICLAVTGSSAKLTLGQDSNQTQRAADKREDETNLDTQLYLILATNRDIDESKMPLTLEPIVKRLHETLAFKHYGLAATLLNRVRSGGHLEVSWVGGPFVVPASSLTSNPSFSQFTTAVKAVPDEAGGLVVRMIDFRFGARVPIVTGQSATTTASTGATSLPVVNYENVGLRTDISAREGVPVVAGTLNMGPSGDAIVVVISAKRAQ